METNTTQETQFIFRRLEEALHLFGREADPHWFWILVLILVLSAGFVYVAWMYKRDSLSVGWPWATFLAVLRCSVYTILAAVFLLPAWQTWERTESHSKVVLAFDVSGSMGNKDDLPTETMPAEKLPTRQEKVIQFLADEQIGFINKLQEKNPIYLYRFGGKVDQAFKVLEGGKTWLAEDRDAWLKPHAQETLPDSWTEGDRAKFLKLLNESGVLAAAATLGDEDKAKFLQRQELLQQLLGGTNLGDSLREIFNRESNNMVQGLIVISDGRNTEFSSQAFEDLRTGARRAKVPIFTIAVGEHRQPISIRITDLQAPEQARPDDKFPVRVEIDGEGLPNAATEVHLDVTDPKKEKKTLTKPFKFNAGAGGPPHAQVEFEIDAAQFGSPTTSGQTPELLEGEWKFLARVPKDKREVFVPKEHVSIEAKVQVVKKPLRILLFAGAPTHDYQFVRSLLVREVDQHRAELSICLQIQRAGVVQDVPADRLLKGFPSRLESEDSPQDKAEDRYANLAYYDLIIAFDPDWTQLQPNQLTALSNWVNRQAGGLIVVASPVNTTQLTRLNNREQLKPILDLYPVILKDSVLENERPTTEPWRLHFPGANAEMEFLNLDEDSKEQLAGWEQFFTGSPKGPGSSDAPVVRGFYSYYPVKEAKSSATVIASFADPRARIDGGKKEQPYLVTMPYGSGKVIYLSSGETWRLRQYREVYHERFWTKLARYAGSSNLTRTSRRGVIVMGQEFTKDQFVPVEAQLFGRDLKPLPKTATPQVQVQPPRGEPLKIDLKDKPSQGDDDWGGWFQARFRVTEPGEYRLHLKINETGDTLSRRFTVKEANPEMDNTRPDFGQLYQIATEMTEILPRMDKQGAEELRLALEGTAARLLQRVEEKNPEATAAGTPPLSREQADRSGAKADGKPAKEELRLLFDLNSAKLIPKCMVTDSKVQRSRGAVQDLWDQGFTLSSNPPIGMATVLLLIATLLSIEWLTRKLLKLA